MKCHEFEEQWINYYGQVLPPDLARHVSECDACQKVWEAQHGVHLAYSTLPDHEPSYFVVQKLLSLSRKESFKLREKSSLVDFVRRWFTELMMPAPLSVMAMLLIAAFVLVRSGEDLKNGDATGDDSSVAQPVASQELTPLRERLLTNPLSTGLQPKPVTTWNPSSVQPVSNAEGQSDPKWQDALAQNPNITGNGVVTNNDKIDPDTLTREADADALLMRGRRLKSAGRLDLAIGDFEVIYQNYPDYTYISDVLIFRAQCYFMLGDRPKALESLEEFAKRFPDRRDTVDPMINQLLNIQ